MNNTPETNGEGGLEIRLARADEVAEIQRIGLDADARFVEAGHPELAGETIPSEAAERAIRDARLWVVARAGEVIGWAILGRIGGELVLGQISVSQRAGRTGAGTALLRALIEHARARGEPSMVLNTQTDVPWNAPWYAKHGFEVIEASGRASYADYAADQRRRRLEPSRAYAALTRITLSFPRDLVWEILRP